MKNCLPFSLICLLLFSCQTPKHSLSISAGEIDRNQSIVHFTLPEDIAWEKGGLELFNKENGKTIPLQKTDKTTAAFVLDEPLAAGVEREYVLIPAKEAKIRMLAVKDEQERNFLMIQGNPH